MGYTEFEYLLNLFKDRLGEQVEDVDMKNRTFSIRSDSYDGDEMLFVFDKNDKLKEVE